MGRRKHLLPLKTQAMPESLMNIRYSDSQSVPTIFSPTDFQNIDRGEHHRLYNQLGAHLRTVAGTEGVNFAVWAPNADRVSLVGDFNDWDADQHLMNRHAEHGLWELFIPELKPGTLYKYCIDGYRGLRQLKADPFGFQFEKPPRTASIVCPLDDYDWQDGPWLEQRARSNWFQQPVSIYEVHLGSWRQDPRLENGWMNYRQLARQIVEYCSRMNYTHIELLPVSEHPFTGSWGYQTVGYFGVTSRYGEPADFMYFVDYCHQHGLGVIVDWVPAHFPRDAFGMARFDGTALYEHADPRQGAHPDWGTLIFNYGRHQVRDFLISNALFWLDKYHIDGLRVDAVASMLYLDYSRREGDWIPNEFGGRENLHAIQLLRDFNSVAHRDYPGILTIAEESTAWGGVSRPVDAGGLGFSMKWNMGWMNDSLSYFRNQPIHRKYHHDQLTFSIMYAYSENFVLPLSHDEVVHGKRSLIDQMPGDLWQKFANLRLLYTYMWMHPGKKLLFMGSDFAQWHEWNCNEQLQWELLDSEYHQGVNLLVADLNRLLKQEPALHVHDMSGRGFEWIDCQDYQASALTWLRKADATEDTLAICCNFTPVVREHYRVGVPSAGHYVELLNSDSEFYAGSNVGNGSGVDSRPANGTRFGHELELTLPPLGATILKLAEAESS